MLNSELHSEDPYIYHLDSAINILLYLLCMYVCVFFGFLFNHLKQVINYHFTHKYFSIHIFRKVTFSFTINTSKKTDNNSMVSQIPLILKFTQFSPNQHTCSFVSLDYLFMKMVSHCLVLCIIVFQVSEPVVL